MTVVKHCKDCPALCCRFMLFNLATPIDTEGKKYLELHDVLVLGRRLIAVKSKCSMLTSMNTCAIWNDNSRPISCVENTCYSSHLKGDIRKNKQILTWLGEV